MLVGQLPFGGDHGKKPWDCVCGRSRDGGGEGFVSGSGKKVVVQFAFRDRVQVLLVDRGEI